MKIKWARSKSFGFTRYVCSLGRAVIMETRVSETVAAGWGRPRHVRTRKMWRVVVDGKSIRVKVPSQTAFGDVEVETFATLKQAKEAAEAALST